MEGRRYVITGVLTGDSIAFAVAKELQERGAEILLTSFGRHRRLAQRAAKSLHPVPPVLELDVSDRASLDSLADQVREHWDSVDGVLHAIAFAPPAALGGQFLITEPDAAEEAFRVSAFSLKELTVALLPLLRESRHGASVVGLDFDASKAWPGYDWMGVAKAGLEAASRYLAAYLGPLSIRVNLLALGPLATISSSGLPSFREWSRTYVERAPLGWDVDDHAVAAGPACFLLSDASRGMTGEILHVDGGYRIMGETMPGMQWLGASHFLEQRQAEHAAGRS
jgi:meromycolic acid enoyl-[acyl-carrier protein] reductase